MTCELIEYGTRGQTYQGYLSFPGEGREAAPCVLILHDWSGRSETMHEVADEISQSGYVAFAVDMYGKGLRGETAEQCAALMQPFMDRRERIVEALLEAVEVARHDARIDANRIAAIGFCFGGLCALDLARRNLSLVGVVSVHGVFAPIPARPVAPIDAKVLVLHGSRDPYATSSDLERLGAELSASRADWQVHVFGDARHAFTNPGANDPDAGLLYDSSAHARSRRLILDFLREVMASS